MCDQYCLDFLRRHLPPAELLNVAVLEVGARNVNGSIRPWIESFRPRLYRSVDLQHGDGVDELCDAADLVARFGRDAFHVVICTEMLEHVLDWRTAVENLKQVLAPGGLLGLTTRSIGFPYHEFPTDCWRFEPRDTQLIFADFEALQIERLPACGVGVLARKPERHVTPTNLERIELFRMHPQYVE